MKKMNMCQIKKMYKLHPVMEYIKVSNQYLMPLFNKSGIRCGTAYSWDKKDWAVVQNDKGVL